MAPAADPYRTLGLARGASLEDVKRAYRRLAKVNHPDAAGPAALPRFLAIQAAYEQLAEGKDAAPSRPSTPKASSADQTRSDAAHRAYGGRTRRSRARPAASKTPPRPDRPADAAGDNPKGRGKATLGSTSYDGVDAATPFEPDWGGASWYGTTSGTYWTINPKEYADPRKHGPEYQARARRAARARGGTAAGPATAPEASAAPAPDTAAPAADTAAPNAAPDPAAPDVSDEPVHTTTSWWDATAADPEPEWATASASASSSPPRPGTAPRSAPRATATPKATAAPPPPPDLGAAATDLGRALTDERSARGRWRLAQAVVGWLPIAFAIGWALGESTGCSRSAASCDGFDAMLAPLASLAALGLLLLIPRLAALAAAAAIAVAIVAVPAAAILSSTNGGDEPPDRSAALGAILLAAWLIGLAVALARRFRGRSSPVAPGRPVS